MQVAAAHELTRSRLTFGNAIPLDRAITRGARTTGWDTAGFKQRGDPLNLIQFVLA